MTMPLRVFIGWDPRETAAYHVLAHSIIARASRPVSITPIKRSHLGGHYWRARGPTESTEFSLTRFLTPWLAGYQGLALFLDCDMLCLGDIADLFDLATGDRAVWVCQHDYQPKPGPKFLGQPQTVYQRKNWSSVMLFDAAQCEALTPAYVNGASGLDLHRFAWTTDDRIGSLPLAWNWLCGEYAPNPDAKLLHYTRGGPWFDEFRDSDHAVEWHAERAAMLGARSA